MTLLERIENFFEGTELVEATRAELIAKLRKSGALDADHYPSMIKRAKLGVAKQKPWIGVARSRSIRDWTARDRKLP